MTTLPSFVELMATLGIDPPNGSSQATSSTSPASQSSPSSPRLEKLAIPASSPTRSRSSPSLRDQVTRSRTARYNPYSPTLTSTTRTPRRGSVSSVSSFSSSSSEKSHRAGSSSPRLSPSPRIRRKHQGNKLTINVFGSSTDLAANTPISSYVRRKTPVTSPTSPTFSRESSNPPPSYPMPFTLPTLPTFLPQSASSDSFPITPDSEAEGFSVRPAPSPKGSVESLPEDPTHSSPRYHTGIRISTSPRSSPNNVNTDKFSKHPVVQVA
ncbi:hypothetical protein V5O48_000038 [Marasmius crinis-equi]|uniref:Uncharacterized protein n=1 Tax=Marasmius crinis-equi TaxID=585013 RepID=A0ABR3G2R2_9AGAR